MALKVRAKRPDPKFRQIIEVLKQYDAAHPKAKIETYRWNSICVRIRVIDPDFKGVIRTRRDEELWKLIEQLPEEVVSEISMLLLLTPAEAKKSFANMEFDDPVPSRL